MVIIGFLLFSGSTVHSPKGEGMGTDCALS